MPVTDEIRAQIEALQAEQEKIENDHEHCEYPPDIDKRMAEIETLIEELNDQPGNIVKKKSARWRTGMPRKSRTNRHPSRPRPS